MVIFFALDARAGSTRGGRVFFHPENGPTAKNENRMQYRIQDRGGVFFHQALSARVELAVLRYDRYRLEEVGNALADTRKVRGPWVYGASGARIALNATRGAWALERAPRRAECGVFTHARARVCSRICPRLFLRRRGCSGSPSWSSPSFRAVDASPLMLIQRCSNWFV